jgi:hypothetical protein
MLRGSSLRSLKNRNVRRPAEFCPVIMPLPLYLRATAVAGAGSVSERRKTVTVRVANPQKGLDRKVTILRGLFWISAFISIHCKNKWKRLAAALLRVLEGWGA